MGEHLAAVAVLLVSVPAIALIVGWAVARRRHDPGDVVWWLSPGSVKVWFAAAILVAALASFVFG